MTLPLRRLIVTVLVAAGLLLGGLPTAANASSATITTIKVGGQPTGMVITPDGTRAYVANPGTSTVNVIDVAARRLLTSIPVGANPQPPAITADGTTVFVSCQGANTLQVIDVASNAVTATIPVGAGPGAPLAQYSTVYVPNVGSNDLSVVDIASRTVVATIPVGTGPTTPTPGTGSQYQPYSSVLFVPNVPVGTISVVDTTTNSVTGTVDLIGTVSGAAVSPFLGVLSSGLYASDPEAGTVTLMSQPDARVGLEVAVQKRPGTPTVNVDGTQVYVPNAGSDSVSVVDVEASPVTVVATIPVGDAPGTAVMDGAGTSMYVPNYGSSTVSVIDTETRAVRAYYRVGTRPVGVALTSSGKTMLVSNSGDGTVSVVSTKASALPKPPTKVSGSSTKSKQVKVSWKKSSASGVTGYVVTALPGGKSCSTTGTTCTVKGLTGGKKYTFAVQAKSKYGAGAPADSSKVKVKK